MAHAVVVAGWVADDVLAGNDGLVWLGADAAGAAGLHEGAYWLRGREGNGEVGELGSCWVAGHEVVAGRY